MNEQSDNSLDPNPSAVTPSEQEAAQVANQSSHQRAEHLIGLVKCGYGWETSKAPETDLATAIPVEVEFRLEEEQRRSVSAAWNKYIAECEDVLPKTPEEIEEALGFIIDMVWYNRCHRRTLEEGPTSFTPEHWKQIQAHAVAVENRLGERNLKPLTQGQLDFLHGRLSAFREIFGDDDEAILDT